jgi:hypothetical protein
METYTHPEKSPTTHPTLESLLISLQKTAMILAPFAKIKGRVLM